MKKLFYAALFISNLMAMEPQQNEEQNSSEKLRLLQVTPTPPTGYAPWEQVAAKRLAFQILKEILNDWKLKWPGLVYIKSFKELQEIIDKTIDKNTGINNTISKKLIRKHLSNLNKYLNKKFKEESNCKTNAEYRVFWEGAKKEICQFMNVTYDAQFINLKKQLPLLNLKQLQELEILTKQLKFIEITDPTTRREILMKWAMCLAGGLSFCGFYYLVGELQNDKESSHIWNIIALSCLIIMGYIIPIASYIMAPQNLSYRSASWPEAYDIINLITEIEKAIGNYIDPDFINNMEEESNIVEVQEA